MDLEALERLGRLRDSGVLSEEEFAVQKQLLLANTDSVAPVTIEEPAESPPKTTTRNLVIGLTAASLIVLGLWVFSGNNNQREMGPSQQTAETDVGEISDTNSVVLPAGGGDIQSAFRAAFGKPNSAVVKLKDEEVLFKPGQVVQTAFGPVLISVGNVLDAGHVSAGKVAIHYLKGTPSGFQVTKSFVPAVETGSMGQVGEWSISRSLSDYPVLYVEGGGTWQGTTCSWADLVELRPEGPVTSDPIPVYYGDEGAMESKYPKGIEGKITDVRKGQSFRIKYIGDLTFTETYRRAGQKFELVGGETKLPTC